MVGSTVIQNINYCIVLHIIGYLQTQYKISIPNNHLADFTMKYPGEKIFYLALFYHLLTIYFGVGDYCLSDSPTPCLFSSQLSSLY